MEIQNSRFKIQNGGAGTEGQELRQYQETGPKLLAFQASPGHDAWNMTCVLAGHGSVTRSQPARPSLQDPRPASPLEHLGRSKPRGSESSVVETGVHPHVRDRAARGQGKPVGFAFCLELELLPPSAAALKDEADQIARIIATVVIKTKRRLVVENASGALALLFSKVLF